MNWNLLLLIFLLALGCGAVAAQDTPDQELQDAFEDLEDEITEFFLAYDSNSNGKVTISELRKATASLLETTPDDPSVTIYLGQAMCLLVAADTDDDGGCSKAEFRALRRAQIKDPAYKPALSKADVALLRKEQYGPVYKLFMDMADTNSDGKLSRDEYKAQVGDTTDFDKCDTNKDGMIDRAEMEADWLKELGKSFELPKEEPAQKEPSDPQEQPEPKKPSVTEEKPPALEKPPVTEDKPPVPAALPDSVFNKAGRNWTTKQSSKLGTMENTSYVKTEVISVKDGEATIRTQVLNKDKQPLLNQPARETTRALKEEAVEEATVDLGKETITAAGRDFECKVSEVPRGQGTIKTWKSIKYPGLVVKSVTKSGSVETSSVLDEFNE
ncbi:MAG: hypothetical protein KF754_00975 [Planctomycetes bacterium]|nr:hypothetical protein [Planctomycetota bacterium]